jgi:hypothetical protein
MPLPRKIDEPEPEGEDRPSVFQPLAAASVAMYRAIEDVAFGAFTPASLRLSAPEAPRVGEYYADYSDLTPEEVAAEDAECAELFANSKPSSR